MKDFDKLNRFLYGTNIASLFKLKHIMDRSTYLK